MINMKKILVVGYGSIGKRHVENLLSISNLEVIVCTERNDVSKLKKHAKVYSTIKQCLEEKPDIGIIANETSLHVPTAIKLAEAGLDLFLEKPLSNSLKDVEKLYAIVKKKKLITQMGCNMRFHPCIKKIKSMVEQQKIGRIISVQVQNCSYLPDYHPWEDYRNGYAARKDLGGGIILTQIHEIDYMYWLFQEVENVISISGKFSDLDITTEDYVSSLLKFKNKIIGELHMDYFQRPDFRSCKIRGTKGEIYWDSDNNHVNVYAMNKKRWKMEMEVKNYQRNFSYVAQLKHFIKCVKQRKETINDIEQGIATLKIALAMKKSSKTMKSVVV
jgi:predicted dehydrogenase